MSRHILVIGGAGYVGSHFARYAMRRGYRVAVLDDLSTGHQAAVRDAEFIHGDLNHREAFRTHLESTHYDAVFHFAASCLVGESVANPALYYRNNVLAAFHMLEAMRATNHGRVVFSSSCAVYGIPQALPLREDHPKAPISPYGRTKLAIEWMLEDYQTAYGIRSAALRYFNAAGCEPSDGLGEDHDPETHLIPNVVRYVLGCTGELVLFGDDYPTPDGTCVRDYIHVTDLAEAHLKALDKLEEIPLIRLNLGTGRGYSNREVVQAVSDVAGRELNPTIGPRRPGDPAELTADAGLAFELLQWRPTRSDVRAIVAEVLEWMQSHPRGYQDRATSDRQEGTI